MFFSKKLKYLLAFSENTSMSDAAEALNITPSALYQTLSSIENEFGKKITLKKNNKLTLNEDGVMLINKINKPFRDMSEIINDFSKNNKEKFKVLTEGFPLTNVYSTLKKYNIGVNIEDLDVVSSNSSSLSHDINNHIYDVIISPININVRKHNIRKINIAPEKVGIVLHKDLIDGSRDPLIIMRKYLLIHTHAVINHQLTTSMLKKIKEMDVDVKFIKVNEFEISWYLNNKLGYTFLTEDFFLNFVKNNNDLEFIHEPLNFFLHRKIYIGLGFFE